LQSGTHFSRLVFCSEVKPIVVGKREGLGRAEADFSCGQCVQYWFRQVREGQTLIHAGLSHGKGEGDFWHGSPARLHPPKGADFVGGGYVLTGGVFGTGPSDRGFTRDLIIQMYEGSYPAWAETRL
tara:strand:- start:9390 stop:9767 length:378 start_codon:yes stop_codon:yes gene_type:complete